MAVIPPALFAASADAYDAAVASADVVDAFCSSSPWIEAARTAFAPHATPLILQTGAGWAPLAIRTGAVRWVAPWEASWGLTASLVGADGDRLAGEVVEELMAQRPAWDALYLSGLARHGAAFSGLVRRLSRRFRLGASAPTVRCVASLEGGAEGFLSRRTPKFRKALRQAQRADTLRFVVDRRLDEAGGVDAFARILAIERTSWKGQEGVGITEGPMRVFYAEMIPRLAARGLLRVTWALHQDQPVGYVLGGVFAGAYRGLQFSFDAAMAERSVGNLMQWATIQDLCEEGVGRYDLGTEMEYKLRWSDQRVESVALVAR